MISEILLCALIAVESGGRDITGDGGLAVGPLQIHPCVVSDVNRIHHKTFTLEDRHDITKSKEIARLYINHYAGKSASFQEAAFCWNGGAAFRKAKGKKLKNLKRYWGRVQKVLNERR